MIFVRVASDEHMFAEIYRSRVQAWIHGVRTGEPEKDIRASLEAIPLSDAERLRTVYQLITNDEKDGGAGVRPHDEDWPELESLFCLHDHAFNKHWIQKWSTKWKLDIEDLDEIRYKFGAKVAYYFAFEQTYFNFLWFPSVAGIAAWLFLDTCSPIYAAVIGLWCIVFVEWWKHRERDLGLRWSTQGVSSIDIKRHGFQGTQEIEDPATGEMTKTFPATERLKRQLLQIPFAIFAAVALSSLIVLCFAIEVFIGEVYDGPGKSILTYLPTVIITTCLPLVTGALTAVAKRLNNYENYETETQYEQALTGKLFVLDFFTSYLGIILTAFVYVPFGQILVPYLDVFQVVTGSLTTHDAKGAPVENQGTYSINPDRLRKQVIYFAVTASIVNFAMEVVVPYLKRQGFIKIRELTSKKDIKKSTDAYDHPEEKEFLARITGEAELAAYDVHTDLREMIIQFGYLSLFSVVWPLVPLAFQVNNWFELRADAFKICLEMQRPTPVRTDTIGPWLAALEFLTWFGSITMAALAYMFANDGVGPDGNPHDLKAWGLLLSILLSENLYLVAHRAVAWAISKIDSPGRQKERRDRYLTREKFLRESLNELKRAPTFAAEDEKADEHDLTFDRATLEEQQRASTLRDANPATLFWSRQPGWRETAKMGQVFIESAAAEEKAGREKKEL